MLLISMLLYATGLFFFVEWCKKSYKLSTVLFVLILASLPLWMGQIEGWFRWVKYLSVFIPVIILGLSRIAATDEKKGGFWRFMASDKLLIFFHAMIFLNILEATLKDISLGNYYNALAGAVLCATIPLAPKFWRFSKKEKGVILSYTPLFWAFLYTTWNACFVYAESPLYFAGSATILLVAFIYPILYKRPELYIHARVYTLTMHLLLRGTFDFFPQYMNATHLFDSKILFYWGVVNTVLAVPYLLWHVYHIKQKSAEVAFGLTK